MFTLRFIGNLSVQHQQNVPERWGVWKCSCGLVRHPFRLTVSDGCRLPSAADLPLSMRSWYPAVPPHPQHTHTIIHFHRAFLDEQAATAAPSALMFWEIFAVIDLEGGGGGYGTATLICQWRGLIILLPQSMSLIVLHDVAWLIIEIRIFNSFKWDDGISEARNKISYCSWIRDGVADKRLIKHEEQLLWTEAISVEEEVNGFTFLPQMSFWKWRSGKENDW